MKPAQAAKAAGLESLAQMSLISGVDTRTLQNWHYQKPKLFNVVAVGCVWLKGGAKS